MSTESSCEEQNYQNKTIIDLEIGVLEEDDDDGQQSDNDDIPNKICCCINRSILDYMDVMIGKTIAMVCSLSVVIIIIILVR